MLPIARSSFLTALLLAGTALYSQVKFQVNSQNVYTIRDTLNGIVYAFDSGSEHSNLFDKGKINYSFGGVSLAQNARGGMKFIRKAKIRENVPGLGTIRTDANILADEAFSSENCIPFDLLLGARVMKKHKLHFDNRRNILTRLDSLPADMGGYMRLELKHGFFNHDYYTILDINGRREKFLVDTGYSGHITMKSAQNNREAADAYDYLDLVAFSIEETSVKRYDNNTILHNGIRFKNGVVYSYTSKGMNIIGNAFFLNFDDVIFDLKGKAIYLRNEHQRADPFPDDVVFGADNEGVFRVVYIKSSGVYYRQGFRVGDRITIQDRELERRLLAAPCQAIEILRDWQKRKGVPFPIAKG